MNRTPIFQYFLMEYFDGDVKFLTEATGYTLSQVRNWANGDVQPNKNTIEVVAHSALAPEFRIVVEFARFSPDDEVRRQLREALQEYSDLSGIYAFYDSMANLLYVGKATKLLDEMYQSIRQPISVKFPRGVDQLPQQRYEVVRYFSAYEVAGRPWAGYPKHVESLILRISKPPLNTRIGSLERLESSEE